MNLSIRISSGSRLGRLEAGVDSIEFLKVKVVSYRAAIYPAPVKQAACHTVLTLMMEFVGDQLCATNTLIFKGAKTTS